MKKDKLRDFILLTVIFSSLAMSKPNEVVAEGGAYNNDIVLENYNKDRGTLLTVQREISKYENNIVLSLLGEQPYKRITEVYYEETESPLGKYTTVADALETINNTKTINADVKVSYYYDKKEEKVAQIVSVTQGSQEKYTCLLYNLDGTLYNVYNIK